jgi:hypothetical protein
MVCNYEAELITKFNDKTIFKGGNKFSVSPKDVYLYELAFLPNAEDKFEVKTQDKYIFQLLNLILFIY